MALLVTSADGGNDAGLGRLLAFGEDGKSLGREPINSKRSADVRFGARSRLKSDIA